MISNDTSGQKAVVSHWLWKKICSVMLVTSALNCHFIGISENAFGQDPSQSEENAKSGLVDRDSLWTRLQGEDWPGFLGLNRDGRSNETGILTDWSNGKLKTLWEIKTGQGYGMGSVAAGRYFHFDRVDGNGRLRSIHAETGELIWDFSYRSQYQDMYGYDSGPRASPVVDGNRVYIFGVKGQLFCLNAVTGTEIWSVDTAKMFGVIQNFFGVGSTPAIHGNTLLVMVGGSGGQPGKVGPNEMPNVKPDGSALVGFDKLSGAVKFKVGDDLASYASIKLAKLQNKEVALVWARNQLMGIDPLTGILLFEFPWRSRIIESVNASTPVVIDDQIFLTECYGPGGVLLKYENRELKQIWSDDRRRNKSMAAHWNTPVLHEGYLYGSSGRNSGDAQLRCVELATGRVAWTKKGLRRASVTLVDRHLIVLGEYGVLSLIKATPEKYDEVATLGRESGVNLKYPCWAAPIVSHGLMIVRDKNKVVCFDLIPQE